MKRPTWATIVGVLGIIFGCFGILGAGQEIFMPKMIEMQKEIFTQMQKTSTPQQNNQPTKNAEDPSQENKNVRPSLSPEMFVSMQKMWEVPSWFGTFSIYSGISKAIISALYLLASIWLLQIKPTSIRLFYWAAGSSIALSIVKGIIILSTISFMGMAMMFGGAFGALIDIILIIVVVTGNKEAFKLNPTPEMQPIKNT